MNYRRYIGFKIYWNFLWSRPYKIRLKCQISEGQIPQIYGAFRCSIFEFINSVGHGLSFFIFLLNLWDCPILTIPNLHQGLPFIKMTSILFYVFSNLFPFKKSFLSKWHLFFFKSANTTINPSWGSVSISWNRLFEAWDVRKVRLIRYVSVLSVLNLMSQIDDLSKWETDPLKVAIVSPHLLVFR